MNEEIFPYAQEDATSICRERNQRVAESDMERDVRCSGSFAESQDRLARVLNALTELALKGDSNGRRNEAA